MRTIFAVLVVGLMCGCTSIQDVNRLEAEAFKEHPTKINVPEFYTTEDFDESIAIAYQLSEVYFQLSVDAAEGQDLAAFGLIGSAAVAAGGLLFGSHTDLIAGAGLAAGTMGAGTSYLNSGEAALRLAQAGNQMICLVAAAQQTNVPFNNLAAKGFYASHEAFDTERRNIMATSIATVRGNLRLQLQRQLPDYDTLVTQLLAAAHSRGADGEKPGILTESELILAELKKRNDQFREAAGKCVITG